MANSDIRKGLVPVDHLINRGLCGKSRPYHARSDYAVAMFVGDSVLVMGTSNLTKLQDNQIATLPDVNLATAGDGNFIAGVVTGFIITGANNTPFRSNYKPASTEAIVLVNDDPYTIFEIQADSDTAIAATDISANANLIYTHGGDTVSGRSGNELDTSSMTTTATYQLRILGLVNDPSNTVGLNAKLLVLINKHFYAKLTAGI